MKHYNALAYSLRQLLVWLLFEETRDDLSRRRQTSQGPNDRVVNVLSFGAGTMIRFQSKSK